MCWDKVVAAVTSPGSVGGVPIICQTVKVNIASATAQPFSHTHCKTPTGPHRHSQTPVPLLVSAVLVGNLKLVTEPDILAVWLLIMQRGAASHEPSYCSLNSLPLPLFSPCALLQRLLMLMYDKCNISYDAKSNVMMNQAGGWLHYSNYKKQVNQPLNKVIHVWHQVKSCG